MDWWIILLITLAVFITLVLIIPILIGYIYRGMAKTAPPARMEGKTVIVTGASGGIGKLTAENLARRGARVIMACRNLKKAQPIADDIISKTGNQNVKVKRLDLSDFDSVRQFAAEINEEEPHVNVLLNNAGIFTDNRETNKDGYELILATNHYGHFLLTILLLGKLKASAPSRVVVLSSIAHEFGRIDFDDLHYENKKFDSLDAYAQSKLANMLFSKELNRRLEGTGVVSYSVHPGAVETEILDNKTSFKNVMIRIVVKLTARTADQGSQTSVYLCSAEEIKGNPGDYFVDCKVQRPKPRGEDMEVAKKLWEVTAKELKLTESETALLP